MVLAVEGLVSFYVGYRGHCTKCAPEAVRLATQTEQLAATEWRSALQAILDAAAAGEETAAEAEEQFTPPPPPAAAPTAAAPAAHDDQPPQFALADGPAQAAVQEQALPTLVNDEEMLAALLPEAAAQEEAPQQEAPTLGLKFRS